MTAHNIRAARAWTLAGRWRSLAGCALVAALAVPVHAAPQRMATSKVDKADVPAALKGLPITLIAASLVAVSFFGFKGLVENLFS